MHNVVYSSVELHENNPSCYKWDAEIGNVCYWCSREYVYLFPGFPCSALLTTYVTFEPPAFPGSFKVTYAVKKMGWEMAWEQGYKLIVLWSVWRIYSGSDVTFN